MMPRPGDVVLYPVSGRSGWTSRLVAAGELLLGAGRGLEQYSHAAILDVDGHQFEAKWPKTGRFKVDHSRPLEIWNVGNPSDSQRRDILNWCREHEGEWYNMIGLLSFGLLGLKRTAVCSQFVGLSYGAARPGIKIPFEGKRILSPNAIADFDRAHLVKRYERGTRR